MMETTTAPAKAATARPKTPPALNRWPEPWKGAIGLPVAPGTTTDDASVVPAVGPGTAGAGGAATAGGEGGPAAKPTLGASVVAPGAAGEAVVNPTWGTVTWVLRTEVE